MISFIQGKIIASNLNKITVLTAGGVGYEVFVNIKSSDWTVGKEVGLLTYMSVRENAMELFGFADAEEKNLFEKFLLVNGIGPKTALHLLSLGSIEQISDAISRGDVGYLTNVSGIGRKIAERIVVELKSKIKSQKSKIDGQDSNVITDVVEGLIALGYSAQEARDAIQNIDSKNKTSEQLLKEALQRIK